MALKQRGLTGVELAVSDDHAGLRKAIEEVLSEAAYADLLPATRLGSALTGFRREPRLLEVAIDKDSPVI